VRPAYPNAAVFAHPSISAAQLHEVCVSAGMDYERTECGNFQLIPAPQTPPKAAPSLAAPAGAGTLRMECPAA